MDDDLLHVITILVSAIRTRKENEKYKLADEAYSHLYDIIRNLNSGQYGVEERGV